MADVYERAHAFLFPSREDVFGLALVEAMAAGLACATSRAPGAVADLCADDENALVVHSHDPRAWAHTIERLVSDDGLCRRLGSRGAKTIDARWTLDHAVDAMAAGLRLGLLTRR